MAGRITTSPQKWEPSGSGGIVIAPSAVAWNYSSWTELIASTPADWYITGANIHTPNILGVEYEMEIGLGALGFETKKIAVHSYVDRWNGASQSNIYLAPAVFIPSGSRISIRFRKDGTDTGNITISLSYLDNLGGLDQYINAELNCIPSGSNGITVSSNAASWGAGNWVEFIAAGGTDDILIVAMQANRTSITDMQIELGIGNAGFETLIGVPLAFRADTTPGYYALTVPILISAGNRIAIRVKSFTSGIARDYQVNMMYYGVAPTPSVTPGNKMSLGTNFGRIWIS